jgi:hypothetical protein
LTLQLSAGTYAFAVQVTDDAGHVSTNYVIVGISSAP